MKRIVIIVGLVAAFGLGFLLRPTGHQDAAPPQEGATAQAEIWTCSMHPQIKLPHPGKCPICFMDLIPLQNGHDEELGPRTLQMSEAAAALAEIQTTPVRRAAASARLRLIGRLDTDETRVRTISSWIPGRIDTLFVDFTGAAVAQGAPMASIYSPELYAAQAELISSLRARDRLAGSPDSMMVRTARATVASARRRLSLWGLGQEQIDAVERRGRPTDHLQISSPLGGIVIHKMVREGDYVKTGQPLFKVADLSALWLVLDAYESQLTWLTEGQEVGFTVASLPGRSFTGTVIFIDPVLDPVTRTAAVRVEVSNPDGLLKPGVFADAVLKADASVLGAGSNALLVPASAPLITGKRALVYVREPDHDKPTFTGREVVLGPRMGDDYMVMEGLQEGEQVVTNGNFKIDSALQIQAKPSMMGPGGGPVPGHHHDGMAAGAANGGEGMDMSTAPATPTRLTAPAAFKDQLADVVDAYLKIQAALADDDAAAAATAAGSLSDAVGAVDMALLDHEAHTVWMSSVARLSGGAKAIRDTDDLGRQRAAFLDLGPALWSVLDRFGPGTVTLRRFHCPMANHNQGGDWIQTSTTTENPYFGSAMLGCGSQTDSLAADTAGGR